MVGGREARNANSDTAKGLEAQLLLARGARVMLVANLWTECGLVNGSMGTIHDILFGDQGPPCLPIAVFIAWESKTGTSCSRLQIPIYLAWAITVHKSQGLTIQKAIIDFGEKEFAAGLSFVAVSRVRALKDILFRPFNFERLQRIKNCKRMHDRKVEEGRLISML